MNLIRLLLAATLIIISCSGISFGPRAHEVVIVAAVDVESAEHGHSHDESGDVVLGHAHEHDSTDHAHETFGQVVISQLEQGLEHRVSMSPLRVRCKVAPQLALERPPKTVAVA